jgi:macrolide transport system ATP-binding/permease protein
MSILRLAGVTREVGTFTILDSIDAAIALGDRVGLVGPNGQWQDDAAPHRRRTRRARSRRGPPQAGSEPGSAGQEAHFDAAFMASPDLRTAVRSGAAHLDAMAAELSELEHAGRAGESVYAELQHRFDALGGYTLDLRVDSALSGLGFARTSGPDRRPRCPVASRRARRWPAS